MTSHVMCKQCKEVFACETIDAGIEAVSCPACGFSGPPAGVMKITGIPSLEVFKRNYGKANFPKADKLG